MLPVDRVLRLLELVHGETVAAGLDEGPARGFVIAYAEAMLPEYFFDIVAEIKRFDARARRQQAAARRAGGLSGPVLIQATFAWRAEPAV